MHTISMIISFPMENSCDTVNLLGYSTRSSSTHDVRCQEEHFHKWERARRYVASFICLSLLLGRSGHFRRQIVSCQCQTWTSVKVWPCPWTLLAYCFRINSSYIFAWIPMVRIEKSQSVEIGIVQYLDRIDRPGPLLLEWNHQVRLI